MSSSDCKALKRSNHSYLGPDAKVLIGDELGPLVVIIPQEEGVDVAKNNDGEGDKESQVPPHLPAAWRTRNGKLSSVDSIKFLLLLIR